MKAVEKVREARGCLCASLHLHAVVHDCCLMPMPGQGGLRKGSFSARAVWCPSNKHVVPVILGISWQEKSMFELRHQLKTVFTCFHIYTILCYIILYYIILCYIIFNLPCNSFNLRPEQPRELRSAELADWKMQENPSVCCIPISAGNTQLRTSIL